MLVFAGSTNAAVTALHVPPPTGPFHVGTYSIALTDPARRDPQDAKHARSLVIQLWYPTPDQGRRAPYMSPAVAKFLAKSAGVRPELLEGVKLDATLDAAPLRRKAGWPVVLFSPGYGVERELYTGLTVDLASHGYVVVALDHPPATPASSSSQTAMSSSHARRWISQRLSRFALPTHVLSSPKSPDSIDRQVFSGDLDLARVGMFGHSLGGAAAASTMLVDPRVRAGANMDGLLFEPARTRGLSRPFLLMNADPDSQ